MTTTTQPPGTTQAQQQPAAEVVQQQTMESTFSPTCHRAPVTKSLSVATTVNMDDCESNSNMSDDGGDTRRSDDQENVGSFDDDHQGAGKEVSDDDDSSQEEDDDDDDDENDDYSSDTNSSSEDDEVGNNDLQAQELMMMMMMQQKNKQQQPAAAAAPPQPVVVSSQRAASLMALLSSTTQELTQQQQPDSSDAAAALVPTTVPSLPAAEQTAAPVAAASKGQQQKQQAAKTPVVSSQPAAAASLMAFLSTQEQQQGSAAPTTPASAAAMSAMQDADMNSRCSSQGSWDSSEEDDSEQSSSEEDDELLAELPVRPGGAGFQRLQLAVPASSSAEDCSMSVDDDGSSDGDCQTNDGGGTSTGFSSSGCSGGTTTSGSDDESWSCSEEDDEYDQLMNDLPIALGRPGEKPRPPRRIPPTQVRFPHQMQPSSTGAAAPPPTSGCAGGRSTAVAPMMMPPPAPMMLAIGESGNPLEGLQLLQSIRSELEQVGRMIVANNAGEKFLERAHILASINYLATNIPSCVLDFLGQEIRKTYNQKGIQAFQQQKQPPNQQSKQQQQQKQPALLQTKLEQKLMGGNSRQPVIIEGDTDTESIVASVLHIRNGAFSDDDDDDASDLSDHDMDHDDDDDDDDEFDDRFQHEQDNQCLEDDPMAFYMGKASSAVPATAVSADNKSNNQGRLSSSATRAAAAAAQPTMESRDLRLNKMLRSMSNMHAATMEKQQSAAGPARRFRMGQSEAETMLPNGAGGTGGGAVTTNTGGQRFRLPPRAIPEQRSLRHNSSFFNTLRADVENKDDSVPIVASFECALMFIDISGFTRLSTILDPENLSKVINSYFNIIVEQVYSFDGDVQKFAGDALFAEWRASPSAPLDKCVEAAAACAAVLVQKCADYPVYSFGGIVEAAEGQGSPVTTLNVHCGLGVGDMTGIHVGDSTDRREYVYVGEPIEQATEAANEALLGQVIASEKIYDMLEKAGIVPPATSNKGRVIANRDSSELKLTLGMQALSNRVRNAKSRAITEHVDGLAIDALIEYRRLMSLYVHPVVVSNDVAAGDNFRSSRTNRDRQTEDAELRSVYVMFVHPEVDCKLTGNEVEDAETIAVLNLIMNITTRELKRYNGHLRQMIKDDKGFVMIATFGLRGSTFPNLVGERALPATVALHNALSMEIGVESKIGATFGDVYCGPVGGPKRNEYAVMGPSVNLAARLMCSPENPGILVDNGVRKLADRSYGFNALAPVNAKGYKEPVPIFEPLAGLNRSWGHIVPNFVGRQQELKQIMVLANEIMRKDRASPKIAIVSSSSGMGKSTLLAHSIEQIRRSFGKTHMLNRVMITKAVGKESDAVSPLVTIRPILLSMLRSFDGNTGGASVNSRAVSVNSHMETMSWNEEHSMCSSHFSGASTTASGILKVNDRIANIGASLGATAEFVDNFVHSVLADGGKESRFVRMTPELLEEMVEFAVKLFCRCAQQKQLVVVAIDDIHQADAGSWLFLRRIFEQSHDVLVLGTTYCSAGHSLRVEEEFWDELNDIYHKNGRFINIELGPLTRSDLELLTMKTLGVLREDVDPKVLDEVVVQSGGMPKFAVKILESIKERNSSHPTDMEAADGSITEIILHRIDTFDLTVRNTLNIGAVIGESFAFSDVLAVMKENGESKEEDLRRQIIDSIKTAVREGILSLQENQHGETVDIEKSCAEGGAIFSFNHSVWRSTLLSLMLDSRKQEVHRKIAQAMEKRLEEHDGDIEFKKKLFVHWRATGDTSKATATAILAGKALERDLSECGLKQGRELYKSTLRMWGWDSEDTKNEAGFKKQVLDYIEQSDLANILSLLVAHGNNLKLGRCYPKSILAFEDSLRVMEIARAAPQLKDRSIVFPAFVSLSNAIFEGHLHQDAYCRFEKQLIQKFLKETRTHGRLIHHIYALYLHMEFCGKLGEFEKAIAVQSVIRTMYKAERHSRGLRNAYGRDVGAVSFSLAALYQQQLGENRLALKTARRVLKDFITKLETDFYQSLSMIYPIFFVLKEGGYAMEARAFFEKVIVDPYENSSDPKIQSILSIHELLTTLLDISNAQTLDEKSCLKYARWARNSNNLTFAADVNITLGRLGRCGDSVTAETLYLLGSKLPKGSDRDYVLDMGHKISTNANIFNRRHGLKLAQKQAHALSLKLKAIIRQTREPHNLICL